MSLGLNFIADDTVNHLSFCQGRGWSCDHGFCFSSPDAIVVKPSAFTRNFKSTQKSGSKLLDQRSQIYPQAFGTDQDSNLALSHAELQRLTQIAMGPVAALPPPSPCSNDPQLEQSQYSKPILERSSKIGEILGHTAENEEDDHPTQLRSKGPLSQAIIEWGRSIAPTSVPRSPNYENESLR